MIKRKLLSGLGIGALCVTLLPASQILAGEEKTIYDSPATEEFHMPILQSGNNGAAEGSVAGTGVAEGQTGAGEQVDSTTSASEDVKISGYKFKFDINFLSAVEGDDVWEKQVVGEDGVKKDLFPKEVELPDKVFDSKDDPDVSKAMNNYSDGWIVDPDTGYHYIFSGWKEPVEELEKQDDGSYIAVFTYSGTWQQILFSLNFKWEGLPERIGLAIPCDEEARMKNYDEIQAELDKYDKGDLVLDFENDKVYAFKEWKVDDTVPDTKENIEIIKNIGLYTMTATGVFEELESIADIDAVLDEAKKNNPGGITKYILSYDMDVPEGLSPGIIKELPPSAVFKDEDSLKEQVAKDNSSYGVEDIVDEATGKVYMFTGFAEQYGGIDYDSNSAMFSYYGKWKEKEYASGYDWSGLPEDATIKVDDIKAGKISYKTKEELLKNVDTEYVKGTKYTAPNGDIYEFGGWSEADTFRDRPNATEVTMYKGTWTLVQKVSEAKSDKTQTAKNSSTSKAAKTGVGDYSTIYTIVAIAGIAVAAVATGYTIKRRK